MKKKFNFDVVGKTKEGFNVISNIFLLYDTYGLPLQVIYDITQKYNFVISWVHFTQDALKAGWSEKKIKSTIHELFVDIYPPDIRKELDEKINFITSKNSFL